MIEIIFHNHANELISLSGAYLEQNACENNLPNWHDLLFYLTC